MRLKIGQNDFEGLKIEVVPIPTKFAMCCKLKFSQEFNSSYMLQVMQNSKDKIDKLQRISVLLATENTWQGTIIGNNWPYINKPVEIKADFQQNISTQYRIQIQENLWKYREVKVIITRSICKCDAE